MVNIAAVLEQGIGHHRAGQLVEAEQTYRLILAEDPALAAAHFLLSRLLYEQGRFDEAIGSMREVVRINPDDMQSLARLAGMLSEQGNVTEAEACLRRVAQAMPSDPRAHYNLGSILHSQNKFDEAIACYRAALELQPADADVLSAAHNNLGTCLQTLGQADEAIACLRNAVAAAPNSGAMRLNLCHALHFVSGYSPHEVFDEHIRWAAQFADPLSEDREPHKNDRSPDRRLRVGYVSPFFKAQAISYFSEPILASHDHRQFEITCYSDVAQGDASTERFRRYADRWVNTVGRSDVEVAATIRADEIDILVDLTGCLPGNRLLSFARRPAPIQVTYIGYQNTTGMRAMDYRLTDEISDPPGLTEELYTEELVRLPDAFFCFRPLPEAPEINALPAPSNSHVTFGSLNKLSKITPEVLKTWGQLLACVPDSRLIVLTEASAEVPRRVRACLAEFGVAADRVRFEGKRPRLEYLRLIQEMDIALDAFPFTGHTTICEALWMGVPSVMLLGQTYVSRFGASALVNLGLTDLIARTTAEYIEIAAQLAANLGRLQKLRHELRAMMRESPILDAAQFTRNLEHVYRQMWIRWCGSSVDRDETRHLNS